MSMSKTDPKVVYEGVRIVNEQAKERRANSRNFFEKLLASTSKIALNKELWLAAIVVIVTLGVAGVIVSGAGAAGSGGAAATAGAGGAATTAATLAPVTLPASVVPLTITATGAVVPVTATAAGAATAAAASAGLPASVTAAGTAAGSAAIANTVKAAEAVSTVSTLTERAKEIVPKIVDAVNTGRTIDAVIHGEVPPPPLSLEGDNFVQWATSLGMSALQSELTKKLSARSLHELRLKWPPKSGGCKR
jgi:hypothetical protein